MVNWKEDLKRIREGLPESGLVKKVANVVIKRADGSVKAYVPSNRGERPNSVRDRLRETAGLLGYPSVLAEEIILKNRLVEIPKEEMKPKWDLKHTRDGKIYPALKGNIPWEICRGDLFNAILFGHRKGKDSRVFQLQPRYAGYVKQGEGGFAIWNIDEFRPLGDGLVYRFEVTAVFNEGRGGEHPQVYLRALWPIDWDRADKMDYVSSKDIRLPRRGN